MRLILSNTEVNQLAHVVGKCVCGNTVLRLLWEDIEVYNLSITPSNYDIVEHSRTCKLTKLITFYDATMALYIDYEGLQFINELLVLADFPILEDPSNPSGLIFNIKVK